MRVLPASYDAEKQIFTIEGKTTPAKDVGFVGHGMIGSEGYVFIDREEMFYMAEFYPDINSTLDQLLQTLNALNTLTGGSALGSIAVDPLTQVCTANVDMPGQIAAVNALIVQITQQVTELMRNLI